jgi:hypothetical protein
MRMRIIAGIAAAVLLTGCNADTRGNDGPSTEPPRATQGQEAAKSRCVAVPQALVDAIEEGLTVQGGGVLRHAREVKSNDFNNVYMVAADLQGAGLEGASDIGVWATNSLQPGEGLIFAVDAVAKEFSDLGDADRTDAQITRAADGAQQAADCARNA